jgi:precorrin-6A synthase
MRRISVIGIGPGDPEQVTVQAVRVLNTADVIFIADQGEGQPELADLSREVCERYITGRGYRIVTAAGPARGPAVADGRGRAADSYEQLLAQELGEDEHGAFLAWGDPAIYDSTVQVLDEVLARAAVEFELEVIPGISSIQALAARHRVSLARTGQPVHLTTGRLLAQGFPENTDDVAVMLDAECAFTGLDLDGVDIYWGAYVGSGDEILISGPAQEVGPLIVAARDAARRRHGWIMDSYLLRRRDAGS